MEWMGRVTEILPPTKIRLEEQYRPIELKDVGKNIRNNHVYIFWSYRDMKPDPDTKIRISCVASRMLNFQGESKYHYYQDFGQTWLHSPNSKIKEIYLPTSLRKNDSDIFLKSNTEVTHLTFLVSGVFNGRRITSLPCYARLRKEYPDGINGLDNIAAATAVEETKDTDVPTAPAWSIAPTMVAAAAVGAASGYALRKV